LVADILSIGVGATIGAEAVLQEVARRHPKLAMNAPREGTDRHINESKNNIQLPGRVTKLGTSLANVQVKNLRNGPSVCVVWVRRGGEARRDSPRGRDISSNQTAEARLSPKNQRGCLKFLPRPS
jgi:hypothetical protein